MRARLRLLRPAQALVLSFALVIAVGTALLRQPWAAVPGRQLSTTEALFTSTSAVCVTGLIVRLPEDHTVAGQVVIISLIQVGGLGIMTFGLFFLVLAGQRLSLFGRDVILSSLATEPWEDFFPLLKGVIAATVLTEGAGAVLLAVGWWGEKGWLAIPWGAFHSVSAFCNAGFGLHASSLVPWRGNALVSLTVGVLVVLGGLGFLPITELVRKWSGRTRTNLSLHTRTVLTVTAVLLLVGWGGFAALEWGTTLRGLPWHEKLLGVWLQGIVPRTAGFASLDYGAMTPATLLFTMGLMFVGASPGSTGGGVKTTTVGVLVAVIISKLRSRRQVSLNRRGIGSGTVGNAVVVLLLSLAVVVGGLLLVSLAEHRASGGREAQAGCLAEAFEVVSAFGTVGLSTGATPRLTETSWLVLTLTMFVGRVGPLTLAVALAGRSARPEPLYADEELMVG